MRKIKGLKLFAHLFTVAVSAAVLATPSFAVYNTDKAVDGAKAECTTIDRNSNPEVVTRAMANGNMHFGTDTNVAGNAPIQRLWFDQKTGVPYYSSVWGLFQDLVNRPYIEQTVDLKVMEDGRLLCKNNKGKIAKGDVLFIKYDESGDITDSYIASYLVTNVDGDNVQVCGFAKVTDASPSFFDASLRVITSKPQEKLHWVCLHYVPGKDTSK